MNTVTDVNTSNFETKEKKSFNFIKKNNPAINPNPNSNANSNVNVNNYNTENIGTNKLNYTLDSLMNDNFNDKGLMSKLENAYNEDNLHSGVNANTNVNNTSIHLSTQENNNYTEKDNNPNVSMTESKKKGFNFVKKKADDQQSHKAQLDKEEVANNDQQLNDSDVKSLRSLRINNNIINDNISVNLEANEEAINVNNTSIITNPLKDLRSNETKKDRKESINTKDYSAKLNTVVSPRSIKAKCFEDIAKAEDSLKALIINIHHLKKLKAIKEKDLENYNKDLEHLYNHENEAIENNDFEEAQVIDDKINEIKEKVKRIEEQIEINDKEMMQLREQDLLISRNRLKSLEDANSQISKLKASKECELEAFNNNDLNRHKNEKIKIKKMREKLDIIKSNLDSEKSYIDEEEEKIDKVIRSQSNSVFDELGELKVSRTSLLDEIEEIKKILDKKYAELDILNKHIESKEIEIDAIKSNFNHEFNKINTKKKHFEENLKDFAEQTTTYENMLKVYETEEGKFEDKLKSLNKAILEFDAEIAQFKNNVSNMYDDLNKKEYLLKNENEINSKIHLIDMKLNKTIKNKEKNLQEVQSLEINTKRLESETVSVDLRIPALEEEKKNYVTQKNFKEAGKISNELRTLVDNKNKNFAKIEDNKNKIIDLKVENEKINFEIEKIKENKINEEKEFNINKYEYLVKYIETVNTVEKKLTENNINNEELIFVQEEVVFLEDELRKIESLDYIQDKFNLNPPKEDKEELADSIAINSETKQENETDNIKENDEDVNVDNCNEEEEVNFYIKIKKI